MSIEFKRTSLAGGMPKIWRGECKILPGSYKVLNMPDVGTLIERGTLVSANTSTLECTLIKTVQAVESINAKKLAIRKGSIVKVGAKISNGTASATISSIDTSNADKDILTLSVTIADVVAGNVLFETSDGTMPLAEPNVIVGADKKVESLTKDVIDLAYEANVLKSVAAPCPDAWLAGGMCLKNNHSIKYFNQ